MSEGKTNFPRGAFALPEDKRVRRVMERLRVFDWAAKEISRRRYEKYTRLSLAAGCVRCGAGAFPRLHELLAGVAAALGLEAPELYVKREPRPEAELVGEKQVLLVLSTGMLELLEEGQMRCLLAHQVAHIHCGHEPFLMARALASGAADNLGILKGMVAPLRALLEEWAVLAQMSCDRGALLATGDMDSLQGLLARLAGAEALYGGVSAGALAQQYADYAGLRKDTPACPLFKTWSNLYLGIPPHVLRAGELRRWVESGEYSAFLAGNFAESPAEDLSDEEAQALWGEFAGARDSWQATGFDEDIILKMPDLKAQAQRLADTAQGLLKSGAAFAGKTLGALADGLLKAAGDKDDK